MRVRLMCVLVHSGRCQRAARGRDRVDIFLILSHHENASPCELQHLHYTNSKRSHYNSNYMKAIQTGLLYSDNIFYNISLFDIAIHTLKSLKEYTYGRCAPHGGCYCY